MTRLTITSTRILEVDDDAIFAEFPEEWEAAQARGQSAVDFIRESVSELTNGGMDDYDWTRKNLVKLVDEDYDYDWDN